MKIYISHSTKGNYEEELYIPLQNSELNGPHEFVFSHEAGQAINIKDVVRECDLVVAECSQPTFEQGLELGWASGAYVTTVCFYKTGSEVSPLLKDVTEAITPYDSIEELITKVKEAADAL